MNCSFFTFNLYLLFDDCMYCTPSVGSFFSQAVFLASCALVCTAIKYYMFAILPVAVCDLISERHCTYENVDILNMVKLLLTETSRRRWSPADLDILRHKFRDLTHPPSFPRIRQLQEMHPSLRQRTLAQIKTRAWSLLSTCPKA